VAVAVALSSVGFPVGVASGARPGAAAAAWLAWSLGFAAATLAVEVVLARSRSPARDPGPASLGGVVLLQAIAADLAVAGVVPAAVPAAVAPLALSSLAVILLRVQAGRLKRVGWATLAGSTATLAVLVGALR
jgi:hypothetical protein